VAKPTYEELLEVVSELRRLLAERDHQIAELERSVEELRRSGKRQAAPFSKGDPKDKPKRSGRKPGKKYGNQAVRLNHAIYALTRPALGEPVFGMPDEPWPPHGWRSS